ncbi:hypothetical protein GW750_01415 [bacterium]|nr:hypothetical protein [bacterium]
MVAFHTDQTILAGITKAFARKELTFLIVFDPDSASLIVGSTTSFFLTYFCASLANSVVSQSSTLNGCFFVEDDDKTDGDDINIYKHYGLKDWSELVFVSVFVFVFVFVFWAV